MELQEVFEKIDDIAGVFVDNLEENHYSFAQVSETKFSFFIDWQHFEFPLAKLNDSPAKVFAAWKKEKTAKEKEQKAKVKLYNQLAKNPAVKEFLAIAESMQPEF